MSRPEYNQISSVFQTPNHKAFIAFLTAGDPTPDCTVQYIAEMARAGADLIEIGIPFSDPIAEGVVIQDASMRALQSGMTTDGAFEIVRRVREQGGDHAGIPLAFMTYANPVFHYGCDRFFAGCEELGVGAVIVLDLPYEEKQEMEGAAKAHQVHPAVICLKWAVQRGQVPIPFSVKENQYMSNLKSAAEDPLTEEEMKAIEAEDKNCRLIKGQVFLWEGAKGWEDLWDVEGVITKC